MSGQQVGYTRVSSLDQNPDRQLDGVAVDRTFTDSASGRSTARPQLEAVLAFVRDGDTVVVHSMDFRGRLPRRDPEEGRFADALVGSGARVLAWPATWTTSARWCACSRPGGCGCSS